MAAQSPSRRKKFLINPKFQLSFLSYILGIALFTLAVFYGAKLIFFHEVHAYMASVGIPKDHLVFEFITRQSRTMDIIFAIAALIEVIFLGFVGLRLSHRVAGPLYRLCQHMTAIAGGAPSSEVKFRQGDYFQEVATAYNEQIRASSRK